MQQTIRSITRKFNAFESEVKNEKFTFTFTSTDDALSAALAIQAQLNEAEWVNFFVEGQEDFLPTDQNPTAYFDPREFARDDERVC